MPLRVSSASSWFSPHAMAGSHPRTPILSALIVVCSVAPVFYSAVPLILNSLGLSGTVLWRVSSGVVGLVGIILVANSMPRLVSLPTAERRFPNLGLVLAIAALVCLFANAAGWPWEPSGGLHLLAIWLVIAIAGTSFVRLILGRVL